jgi:hypothetical protein
MKYVAVPVSYDIAIDSDTNAGGDIYNRKYFFDWTKLPKADKWRIQWTFQSGVVAGLATVLTTSPICVHMDELVSAYQYQAEASSAPSHSVFGFLVPNFLSATDGVLGASLEQNETIIMDTLPTQPFFTVKLRSSFSTNPPSAFSSNYVMTLILTPLYEDD